MAGFLSRSIGESKRGMRRALLATAAMMGASALLSAQAQTPPQSAQRGQTLAIEEIVVTARQRSETLQQVPLAITAFSGEQLSRAGVTDLRTLANQTVGLQMDGLGPRSFSLPVIRGVSQVSRSDDENNTAIFLDGVYVSGRDGLDVSLLDLERVEIVKGPQSALYGKNSYAGAINYITKKPGNDFTGRVSGTVGEDGKYAAQGSVSGPILVDKLFARVGVGYDKYKGGHRNTVNNEKYGGFESTFASAALRTTPTEWLEAIATLYYSDDRNDVSIAKNIPGNCEPGADGVFQAFCGVLDARPTGLKFDPRAFGIERDVLRTSFTVNATFDWVKATWITGFNKLNRVGLSDQGWGDGLPFAIYDTAAGLAGGVRGTQRLPTLLSGGNDRRREWSHELRFTSNNDSRLSWLLGGSLYRVRSIQINNGIIDTTAVPAGRSTFFQVALPPTNLTRQLFRNAPSVIDVDAVRGFAATNPNKRVTQIWGIYGSLGYDITDALKATAELRYSSEEKTFTALATGVIFNDTFKSWNPRFTLDYTVNDDVLVYASAARGSKAGGFNTNAPTPPERSYFPETNWTYELGLKSDWLDRRLRTNIALFYMDLKGIQISAVSPSNATIFLTLNTGTGKSQGLEFEATYSLAEGVTLSGGYALSDSKFKTATDGTIRGFPTFARSQDVSGEPLPRRSKHMIVAALDVQQPLFGDWEWYGRADLRYQSKQNSFSSSRLTQVPARTIVNLRAGVIYGNVDFQIYANNLFDYKKPILGGVLVQGLNLAGQRPVATFGDRRQIGATATVKF